MLSSSVLIIDEGRYVLFRDRKTLKYTDCGGSIEWGEDIFRTASRELFEETCKVIFVPPKEIMMLDRFTFDTHTTFILRKKFDEEEYHHNLKLYKEKVFQENDEVVKVKNLEGISLKYPHFMENINNFLVSNKIL